MAQTLSPPFWYPFSVRVTLQCDSVTPLTELCYICIYIYIYIYCDIVSGAQQMVRALLTQAAEGTGVHSR